MDRRVKAKRYAAVFLCTTTTISIHDDEHDYMHAFLPFGLRRRLSPALGRDSMVTYLLEICLLSVVYYYFYYCYYYYYYYYY